MKKELKNNNVIFDKKTNKEWLITLNDILDTEDKTKKQKQIYINLFHNIDTYHELKNTISLDNIKPSKSKIL